MQQNRVTAHPWLHLGMLRDAMLKDSEALQSGTHGQRPNSRDAFIQCDARVKQRVSEESQTSAFEVLPV